MRERDRETERLRERKRERERERERQRQRQRRRETHTHLASDVELAPARPVLGEVVDEDAWGWLAHPLGNAPRKDLVASAVKEGE